MVMAWLTKLNGVPPPIGVAVIRKPGLVVPSAGAATPVTMPVFCTVAIVAMSGLTASNVNVAGMIVPPEDTRAVVKTCV